MILNYEKKKSREEEINFSLQSKGIANAKKIVKMTARSILCETKTSYDSKHLCIMFTEGGGKTEKCATKVLEEMNKESLYIQK